MFIDNFRIYSHPKLIAVFFLGIASGIPLALSASTLAIWLTEVGIDKTAIGLFAAVSTPYALKFLWAPFVDQMPIPYLSRLLGQRTAWMVLIQFGLILCIIALGTTDPTEDVGSTALFAFCVAMFSASQDIIIDAYRVEMLNKDQQGAGAAMSVFGYRVGMLASSAGALYLAEYFSWSVVYLVMAMGVTVGFITVMIAGEPESREQALSGETIFEKALTAKNTARRQGSGFIRLSYCHLKILSAGKGGWLSYCLL